MNVTYYKCKHITEHGQRWIFDVDGNRYDYHTWKPFMSVQGERQGRTIVHRVQPRKRAREGVGTLHQYMPIDPKAPEKSIERFFQLLLLS
jgi:hypothetical protein